MVRIYQHGSDVRISAAAFRWVWRGWQNPLTLFFFHEAREKVQLALGDMMTELTDFVKHTSQLQFEQLTGSEHEKQALEVSQEWMAKYKTLQNKHVRLLPVLTAILTPLQEYHVHVE